MIIVRYADDIIVGFEHEADARRFWDVMRERLQEFSLSLNSEKTRLIEFGRHAVDRRARRGLGKPETFKFLGFTHICGQSRRGKFLLKRRTRRDHAGKAHGDQGGTATADASAHSRTGTMAGASGDGLLRVPRRADPTSRHCAPSITTSESIKSELTRLGPLIGLEVVRPRGQCPACAQTRFAH